MTDCQIRTFDVTDQRVIARFLDVPRELFVPDHARALAYSDTGFTLSGSEADDVRYLLPPMILARMLQGLRLKESDRVLDVGASTGYTAALLSGLVAKVVALESDAVLCADIRTRLSQSGYGSICVRQGPLAEGASSDGPFDAIFVNGAVQTNMDGLFQQLAEGGRLVAVRRVDADPAGQAAKATSYEKWGGTIGARYLFDASAPCLRAFQATPEFAF